jgi:drug/metabolite transporter (DMT)-like permease
VRTLGVVLILAGLVALAFGSVSYTKHEKVIDVGPVEASVDKKERIPLPPIAGGLAMVAGIVLVARGRTA